MASTPPRGTPTKQHRLPAAYYRGGTSRAIIFKAQDLPPNRAAWAPIFRGALGSPDAAYGRQLDGLGGGISSLSKVCVVRGPSAHDALADVDYTFAAVGVADGEVDYSANCGNMSAAVGPFAVDSGLLVPSADGECVVRIYNTNTGKIIRATFEVVGGEAAASGECVVSGVAGAGAPVRLEFVRPGGSKTGVLLPTRNLVDASVDGGVEMTCIDVGNPCVFIEAAALISPVPLAFSPTEIEGNADMMAKLEKIRRDAAMRMGLATAEKDVPGSIPKIAMVWAPRGHQANEELGDVCVRALWVGQPHKAVPATVALALAAAAQLPGTIVHRCLGPQAKAGAGGSVEISHPTGVLKVDAKFDGSGSLESAALYRTARRLMEGTVYWKS